MNLNDQIINIKILLNEYDSIRESRFSEKKIKHSDVIELTDDLREYEYFQISNLGKSIDGREINLIKFGTGSENILCWSQMHGNESTATMALFDLINYIKSNIDSAQIKNLSQKLSIYFIPMLNPDGAEKFTRENAVGIDLNRDALALQSPESKILKEIIFDLKPTFGFNLHDQKIYYTAGYSPNPATISFLAPAYNFEKEINPVRKRAMQLIGNIAKELKSVIPDSIGRYDDEFEPRAFGDNIMKWNTSTVLVESGGYKNDPEKQFIRKVNFLILLYSFLNISEKRYQTADLSDYQNIPENRERLFDLKIKNLIIKSGKSKIKVDLGINRSEKFDSDNSKSYVSSIENIGDLSTFWGYEEFDGEGMSLTESKVFSEYTTLSKNELIKSGYLYFQNDSSINTEVKPENVANFYLSDKNNNLIWAIINGKLIKLADLT